ncbi:MAG: nucleotidyltransferase family protein [Propionivibrio sp.]|uniref:Nucleotidyltransferase family protein n=1 Tax=Candidatus Propionivibrio dominans TaxID=2954373 RepID=A0A9D7FBL7_9RHOO|nr:nucleotidyltransferase family protein [Candidatus Propionivibrio dominans]
MIKRVLIVSALLAPKSLSQLTLMDWDVLIRQGRRANLLARLAHLLIQNDDIDAVPSAPRFHLTSALRMVERQDVAMRWEVACILKSLANVGMQITLLKGAAYVMAGLPTAFGRTFSDVISSCRRASLLKLKAS